MSEPGVCVCSGLFVADFLRTSRYNGRMWRVHRHITGVLAVGSLVRCWVAMGLVCASAIPGHAGWLDGAAWLDRAAWVDGLREAIALGTPLPRPDELTAAARLIKDIQAKPPALVLAAAVTAEGHWTFINQADQRFTAASKQEMAQVYTNLAPEMMSRPAPVVIYLTRSSVFHHGEHLSQLPVDAKLRLHVGDLHYPLRRIGLGAKPTWFAEVRANVFVRTQHEAAFVETAWQLARRLEMRSMRVLALQPDAPDTFRPSAKLEAGSQQAVDAVNPSKLLSALPTLRRQTAVITGRLQGDDQLIYRAPSGAEQALQLKPLRALAAQIDANLVFVNASAPRQPGARNWLWLRVEVDGLVAALQGETLGDFLNKLSGGTGRLFAETRPRGPDRVALGVVPMRAGVLEKQPGIISSVLAELVSEVAGSVLPHAVDGDLVSMRRQQELDRRLLPGVASTIQYGVGLAFFFGLIGLPVALRWWRGIWPAEARSDYAGSGGFQAARAVRWLIFALLFLPIAGLPAALWGLVRLLAWLLRGRRRHGKADADAVTG